MKEAKIVGPSQVFGSDGILRIVCGLVYHMCAAWLLVILSYFTDIASISRSVLQNAQFSIAARIPS